MSALVQTPAATTTWLAADAGLEVGQDIVPDDGHFTGQRIGIVRADDGTAFRRIARADGVLFKQQHPLHAQLGKVEGDGGSDHAAAADDDRVMPLSLSKSPH